MRPFNTSPWFPPSQPTSQSPSQSQSQPFSQYKALSQTLSPAFNQPYNGQQQHPPGPTQGFTHNQAGTPSAYGFLPPQGMPVDHGRFNPHQRPNSAQRTNWSPAGSSDRPPSVPLRNQSGPRLLPSPHDNNMSPINAIPTAPTMDYRVPSTRTKLFQRRKISEQLSQGDSRTSNQQPRVDTKAKKAVANLQDPAPKSRLSQKDPAAKASSLQGDITSTVVSTAQYEKELIESRKRMADKPTVTRPAKRRLATNTTTNSRVSELLLPSPSTSSSLQQARVATYGNESTQDDHQMPSISASRDFRSTLRPLGSDGRSQKPGQGSLPQKEVPQQKVPPKSSKVGKQKATRGTSASSPPGAKDAPSNRSQEVLDQNIRKNYTVDHHSTTLNPPEPEPLTPHHRPASQQQLVEDIVNQSQNISAVTKKPAYTNSSTQYENVEEPSGLSQPEPPQRPPLKSDRSTIDNVLRDAHKMMRPTFDKSKTFNEIMDTLKEIDEMVKSRLHPEEAANYDWIGTWTTHSLLTPEELRKILSG